MKGQKMITAYLHEAGPRGKAPFTRRWNSSHCATNYLWIGNKSNFHDSNDLLFMCKLNLCLHTHFIWHERSKCVYVISVYIQGYIPIVDQQWSLIVITERIDNCSKTRFVMKHDLKMVNEIMATGTQTGMWCGVDSMLW